MRRRDFLQMVPAGAGAMLFSEPLFASSVTYGPSDRKIDLAVIGGGLGGCAAALAALRNGLSVVMTEETDWIGGQLTAQAVPPDEHGAIESYGSTATYRSLRSSIRDFYRRHYPLTEAARNKEHLNPGNGSVSRLCHEPRVALAVLQAMLAPFVSNGQLTILREHVPVAAEMAGDDVQSVRVASRRTGNELTLVATWFVDATELGDLLPLTDTEFVTGAESQSETGELHAPSQAQPDNHQAFTACFLVDHLAGEDHTIERPAEYEFWRDFVPELTPPWPGPLFSFTYSHPHNLKPRKVAFVPNGAAPEGMLNLFLYRRIIDPTNFVPETYQSGVTVVNWPQNDYLLGNLVGVSEEEKSRHIAQSKQLSLSLLYWLQTEAPRPDGGNGWPGLRLRGDLVGTEDGLAKTVYIRESRRIRSQFTVLEEHVGREQRAQVTGQSPSEVSAAPFADSVGVGSYRIDLHPSSGGDNYIDFSSLRFQIPLGALLPIRVRNLFPACKNIGTTHITNGCYRLHPVEWNIGESVGELVAYCQQHGKQASEVRENDKQLDKFQQHLTRQGIELAWPNA